ncbi:MAG TPA: class I SAM-dependent methyltransferase, partial [Ruminococcus sp.]|nr:class I SAM-dependent methyltransferase [Ruminococcus sp.]
MSNISQFLESINNQKGLKGALKRKLFGSFFAGLQAADRDMAELEKRFGDSQGAAAESLSALRSDFESACVNLRNNNNLIERLTSEEEFLRSKLGTVEKKLKGTVVQSAAAASAPAETSAAAAPSGSGSDYEDIDYFDF